VPKVYAFLGLIATYFFFIFFNIGGQFLTNVAGFMIPGYYSLEALFTVGKSDDTQWLTVCFVWDSRLLLTDPSLAVLGRFCLLDSV
jgi:receptor expression-enhancing protein 5/6